MNLHLMLDEKVISRTIEYFEQALPHQNTFVVLMENGREQPKYVIVDDDYVKKVKYGSNEFWNAVGDVNSYSNVIIHHLTSAAVDFINRIQHDRITWIAWGADLYGGLLKPKGYKLFYNEYAIRKLQDPKYPLWKRIYVNILKHKKYRKTINAVRKVKYICAPNGDFELLVKYYPEMRSLVRKDFFYYPLDAMLSKELLEKKILGNDIIVGNSASYYGNHEEVFYQLAQLNIVGRNVIVPLSYGDDKVVNYVINKGGEILGKNFKPILSFMPLNEYNQLLCSAKTYIYGNYRQEATGNIVVALYLGGTVFLHPSNSLLKEFKEMGCVCFSTEQLYERIDYSLTEEEKEKNRSLIAGHYNYHHLLNIIKTDFGTDGIS